MVLADDKYRIVYRRLILWECVIERRGRDSNPRCACAHNGFRDRPIRPLWHLSRVFPMCLVLKIMFEHSSKVYNKTSIEVCFCKQKVLATDFCRLCLGS